MKKLKPFIIFFAVFVIAGIVFFPWKSVQSFVTAKAFKIAADNGIYASVQSMETKGMLDKKFVYRGLIADFPLLQFRTNILTVNPKIFATIFGKPSVSAEFGKGAVTLVTKQQLGWNSGDINISADKEIVRFNDIKIIGDFSVQGFFEVARRNGKISRAQLALSVPEEVENALEFLSRGMIQGLTKESAGKWRLVR